MGLSIPQMALMSRLLDEALPLDAPGRRRWLEALSPEYQSLAGALREALMPVGEGGLAGLEHPNIARLYDAGVGSNGLPYLAMEYVAGEPLTDWCDAHQLAIRERVRLFLQVLDAVQYAHGQRVIHRDIKPSNILVTDSGQVRLLDFGVAKLLAREEEQSD